MYCGEKLFLISMGFWRFCNTLMGFEASVADDERFRIGSLYKSFPLYTFNMFMLDSVLADIALKTNSKLLVKLKGFLVFLC